MSGSSESSPTSEVKPEEKEEKAEKADKASSQDDKEEEEEKEDDEDETVIEPILDGRNSCIFKFFMENSDCPTCGINLLPFPLQTVRIDRALQSIVDKIFPDLIRKDLELEKNFYISRNMPVPESLLEEEGKLKPQPETQEPAPAPKRLKKGEGNKRIYNDEVAFELAVDENSAESVGLPKLDKPFIRTSAKITVFHLKKFLSKKLNIKSTNEVEISYKGELLGTEHSLEYILKTRGVDPTSKGPTFVYRKKKAELGM